jgi:amino acid transporter
MARLKHILIGAPIHSADEGHQRLRKAIALPVFASDAISSTAYATDEILIVLLAVGGAGVASFRPVVPIAIIVCVLMVIVVTSYRQTIMAYPSGGGAYIVSRENLGRTPSLVAGAALLTDYILTVAVSIAGGVLAIRTAVGLDHAWTVPICLLCLTLMTVMNLRGVKESGAAFAGPTYLYVVMLITLVSVGLYRVYVKDLGPIPDRLLSEEGRELKEGTNALGVMILLRAFSSGAVALSGVEAISNGVPAFQKPESKNAATTLMWMGGILGSTFLGVSVLANHLKPFRGDEDGNGLGLMAEHIYGGRGVMFWLTMVATFAILILAANTAYADFPRLASIIAKDGFLPRQFFNRGTRLVFSNGVLFLAIVAGTLIVVFQGNISKLIPLYAFGVFTGFTLSQFGMVKHHFHEREDSWRLGAAINLIGAATTGLIAGIVVVSKFTQGAYIPAVLIPLMVVGFRSIGRHYERNRAAVACEPGYRPPRETHTMVVLVGGINKGVLHGLQYARSLHPDRLLAVTVATDDDDRQRIEQQWLDYDVPVELNILHSPYRELTRPILRFLDELDARHEDDIITVVIPEFVTSWKAQWLHNGSAFALKAKLLYRPHTAVVSVPIHMDRLDLDGLADPPIGGVGNHHVSKEHV